jgi:hypothetical protein
MKKNMAVPSGSSPPPPQSGSSYRSINRVFLGVAILLVVFQVINYSPRSLSLQILMKTVEQEQASSSSSSSSVSFTSRSTSTAPSTRKQRRKVPFDPFSDFSFRAVTKQEMMQHEETSGAAEEAAAYFSHHHCVGTGYKPKTPEAVHGQSEQDSFENRRANFVNRHCHYINLYYRLSDQTFHYLASPEESKIFQEARKADAIVGNSTEFLDAYEQQMKQHELSSTVWTNQLQGNSEGYIPYRASHPHLFTSYAELLNRMNVQIGHDHLGTKTAQQPWRPIVHEHDSMEDFWETIHSEAFAVVEATEKSSSNFYLTLYHPFHSFNIGHLLWDDIESVFSLYDRLVGYETPLSSSSNSIADDLIIPFHVEIPNGKKARNYGGGDPFYRCSPANHVKYNKCTKMYRRVFGNFTGILVDKCSGDLLRSGNWLMGDEAIGVWHTHPKNDSCLEQEPNLLQDHAKRNRLVDDAGLEIKAEFAMVPNVLAGAAGLGHYSCHGDCQAGRSREHYRFRNYFSRNILLSTGESYDNFEPRKRNDKAGYILFSLSGSKASRQEEIHHFKDEIRLCIERYGDGVVKALDLSTLSMKDQVLLLNQTAVLITNHGGVGIAAAFLPFGSAALIFWHHGAKMDHHWYESAGYFRPVFVGPEERPFLNRTMAIIDGQLKETRTEWSNLDKEGK